MQQRSGFRTGEIGPRAAPLQPHAPGSRFAGQVRDSDQHLAALSVSLPGLQQAIGPPSACRVRSTREVLAVPGIEPGFPD